MIIIITFHLYGRFNVSWLCLAGAALLPPSEYQTVSHISWPCLLNVIIKIIWQSTCLWEESDLVHVSWKHQTGYVLPPVKQSDIQEIQLFLLMIHSISCPQSILLDCIRNSSLNTVVDQAGKCKRSKAQSKLKFVNDGRSRRKVFLLLK